MDRDEALLMRCVMVGSGACSGGGCTRWRPDGDPTGSVDPPGDLPDQDLGSIYALLPWLRPEEDPPHSPSPATDMLHPGISRHADGPVGSAGGPAGESEDDEAVYRLLPWLRPGAADAAGGQLPPPPLAGAGEAGERPLLGPDAAASRQFLLFQGFEFAWMCTSHRFTRLGAWVSNPVGHGDAERGVHFEMGFGCYGDEGRFAMNVRRVTLPPGAAYFEPDEPVEATNSWRLDSPSLAVEQLDGVLVVSVEIPYDRLRAAVPPSVEDLASVRIDDFHRDHRCVFLQGFSIEVDGAKLILDELQVGIVSSTWDDKAQVLRLQVDVALSPGVLPAGGAIGVPWLMFPIPIVCDPVQVNLDDRATIRYQVRIGVVAYDTGSRPRFFREGVDWPLDGDEPFDLFDCDSAPQRRTRVASPPVESPANAWGDALVALQYLELRVRARRGTDFTRAADVCSVGEGRIVRRLAMMLLRRGRSEVRHGGMAGYRYSWIGDFSNESVVAYPMEPSLMWGGIACRVAGAVVELARFSGRHAVENLDSECEEPGFVRFDIAQDDVDRVFGGDSFEEDRAADVRLILAGEPLDDDEFAGVNEDPPAEPLLDHRAMACFETQPEYDGCLATLGIGSE